MKAGHLQKVLPEITLLVLATRTPLRIGVYKEGMLIDERSSERKTSEMLLPLLEELMGVYDVKQIIYTRSPGSYMAIKLTYITLKTIEIVRGIECLGCSTFALNDGKPVKAIGNLYFIKEKETIITKKFEEPVDTSFVLPHSIQDLEVDEESTPAYLLPAV